MWVTMKKIDVMQFYMQIKWIYLNNYVNIITFIGIAGILLLLSILTTERILNKDQISEKVEHKEQPLEIKREHIKSFTLYCPCVVLLCLVLVYLEYIRVYPCTKDFFCVCLRL